MKRLLVALALCTVAVPASANCRIIGDSIAVMVANTHILPCAWKNPLTAKGAMDSAWILRHAVPADFAVISAASNDIKDWRGGHRNPRRQQLANRGRTMAHLEALRVKLGCKVCVWIKPALREPGQAVAGIAKKYGDPIISFGTNWDRHHRGDDVHPANPRKLAIASKEFVK